MNEAYSKNFKENPFLQDISGWEQGNNEQELFDFFVAEGGKGPCPTVIEQKEFKSKPIKNHDLKQKRAYSGVVRNTSAQNSIKSPIFRGPRPTQNIKIRLDYIQTESSRQTPANFMVQSEMSDLNPSVLFIPQDLKNNNKNDMKKLIGLLYGPSNNETIDAKKNKKRGSQKNSFKITTMDNKLDHQASLEISQEQIHHMPTTHQSQKNLKVTNMISPLKDRFINYSTNLKYQNPQSFLQKFNKLSARYFSGTPKARINSSIKEVPKSEKIQSIINKKQVCIQNSQNPTKIKSSKKKIKYSFIKNPIPFDGILSPTSTNTQELDRFIKLEMQCFSEFSQRKKQINQREKNLKKKFQQQT